METKKHRTSLKDLARELGVSIATVSRALRSSPEIGQEMQEKVKAPTPLHRVLEKRLRGLLAW